MRKRWNYSFNNNQLEIPFSWYSPSSFSQSSLADNVARTLARIFIAKDMLIVLEALKSSYSHFSLSMLKMFSFSVLCNPKCINTSLTCIYHKPKLIPKSNFCTSSLTTHEKFHIATSQNFLQIKFSTSQTTLFWCGTSYNITTNERTEIFIPHGIKATNTNCWRKKKDMEKNKRTQY